jgi:hypothetical protein
VSWGTSSWALTCYYAGWMLNNNVFFFSNCSTQAAWRCAPSCITGVMVPAWWSPTTQWEKCPRVVRCDIPKKVDCVWRAHCMAPSVTWPLLDFFLWEHLRERTYVHSSCHKNWRSHSKISRWCYNCQFQYAVVCTGKYYATYCHLPPNARHLFWTSIVSVSDTLLQGLSEQT